MVILWLFLFHEMRLFCFSVNINYEQDEKRKTVFDMFCNIGWRFVYYMYALYESQISLSIRIRLKIETSNTTSYIRSSLLMCIKNPKLLVEYQISCCCTVFVMERNQKKEGHKSNVSFQVEFKTLRCLTDFTLYLY